MAKSVLPEKITHPDIIVCEGLDAKKFLIYFLASMIKQDTRYESFEVIDGGGNENLPAFMKSLPNVSGFSAVKTVTLIRDAEKNAAGAEQSAESCFKNANFPAPDSSCVPCMPRGNQIKKITGYALFPKFSQASENGTLEDLCLEILMEERRAEYLHIADDALQNTESKFGSLKRPHKNKLHTYLSLTDKCVGLKLGESAKAGAFDFSSEKLRPLADFLNAMRDAAPRRKYP